MERLEGEVRQALDEKSKNVEYSFGFDQQQQQEEEEGQILLPTPSSSHGDKHILAHERELTIAFESARPPSPHTPISFRTLEQLESQCSQSRALVTESLRHLEYRMGVLASAGRKREEVSVWFSGVKMDFLRDNMARLVFVGKHLYQRAHEKEGKDKGMGGGG